MAMAPAEVVVSARSIAARVLVRVWTQGAFAAAALDAELRRAVGLDPRDAGLATELVYGVLRTEVALERRLDELASKKRSAVEGEARAHLLIGAYAICFLDRVPVFAAVSEAVEGVRREAGTSVAGFTNAVLRRLAADVEAKGRPSLTDAVVASAPGWLRGALRRSLGRAGAEAYLAAGPVPPPIGLCLAPGEDRAAWVERLRQETRGSGGAEIHEGRVSPRAVLVRGAGDVRRLAGAGTSWILQEEGAQVVALALGARPGERVLDACAGRGNKAWLLGFAVGTEGAVDAADLYPAKLEALRSGPVGARVRRSFVVDWTAGSGDVPEGYYDRVLVDAPCSGTGTLRRRPEIGTNREACDVGRLSELQGRIVREAATRVRDGGRLVLAVCSVLREEAEDVVARVIEANADAGSADAGSADAGFAPARSGARRIELVPAPFDSDVVRGISGFAEVAATDTGIGDAAGITAARLLPHVHGTDGYYIASFEVRSR
jgi:16S rRNA (cytosine967-C5)-methyltransferase